VLGYIKHLNKEEADTYEHRKSKHERTTK
jgi:hypothetical protein